MVRAAAFAHRATLRPNSSFGQTRGMNVHASGSYWKERSPFISTSSHPVRRPGARRRSCATALRRTSRRRGHRALRRPSARQRCHPRVRARLAALATVRRSMSNKSERCGILVRTTRAPMLRACCGRESGAAGSCSHQRTAGAPATWSICPRCLASCARSNSSRSPLGAESTSTAATTTLHEMSVPGIPPAGTYESRTSPKVSACSVSLSCEPTSVVQPPSGAPALSASLTAVSAAIVGSVRPARRTHPAGTAMLYRSGVRVTSPPQTHSWRCGSPQRSRRKPPPKRWRVRFHTRATSVAKLRLLGTVFRTLTSRRRRMPARSRQPEFRGGCSDRSTRGCR